MKKAHSLGLYVIVPLTGKDFPGAGRQHDHDEVVG